MATYSGQDPLSRAIKDDARAVVKLFRGFMVKVGNIAINEAKDNFRREGFMDRSVKRWKPRKKPDPGRAILVKSSMLKKSIRRISVSSKRVTVGSKGKAAVYAGVHNYGLKAGRGKGFKMEQRQFLGPSHTTDKRIVILLKKTIKKGFK